MKRTTILSAALAALAVLVAGPSSGFARARSPSDGSAGLRGILLTEPSLEAAGPETRAAVQLAGKLGADSVAIVLPDGRMRSPSGEILSWEDFSVLWRHEGDSAAPDPVLESPATIAALRAFLERGGGLFLSGAAPALLQPLGLEDFALRRGGPGQDGFRAAVVPEDGAHPVFHGLVARSSFVPRAIEITDAGLPAFSDFHGSGGPVRGKLLGRANSGAENPIAEYAAGKGRVVVLGWRLPHYAYAKNPHRANLERLTANILGYLGDPSEWRSAEPVARPAETPSNEGEGNAAGAGDADGEALELAIRDLSESFPDRYPGGAAYLERLETLRMERRAALSTKDEDSKGSQDTKGSRGASNAALASVRERMEVLRREALLANPLLEVESILCIDRAAGALGLPANWDSNSSLNPKGWDDRLASFSPRAPERSFATVFQPTGGEFVGDVDLHFDAKRLLFSMPGTHGRWQVFELSLDGSSPRELALIREPDVDNYDAAYLPDGRVVFTSTATFVGVPCVDGSSHVTNLYRLEHDGSIRQLTVDQEHDWCPTVLPNGRVLYLRWEYTDLPHAHSRILFQMNPDGTGQMEYFGSNSYFPNSFFYARPIPDHPGRVVGIATGHHGVARSGRLLIVDASRGRRETTGVVHEVPHRGRAVEPIVRDELADGIWPQFLHPFPLSGKYFLVSAKPRPESPWGIYLVDVFDNMTLLAERPGRALLEPLPLAKRPVPPAIPDRTEPGRKDALVLVTDIYRGGGLRGVPRGTVKSLRLVTYRFGYRGMGGLLGTIGMDGPWDIKHILGTVPVDEDGSAFFRVPAMTPLALQPLDADGKALQLMRSWFTAMPGERVSCVGCHEEQDSVNAVRPPQAALRVPSEIAPRSTEGLGFSFAREVQPVLDRHCTGCHDGRAPASGGPIPDLRGDRMIDDWASGISGHAGAAQGGKFSVSYAELHRYVRRPGIESDLHMLSPLEFHADSTELVQLLRKGHHGVTLDPASWEPLVAWIDLNAPYHGTWTEIAGADRVRPVATRAREMRVRYAGVDEDWEAVPADRPRAEASAALAARTPAPAVGPSASASEAAVAGWPFDAAEAVRRQAALGDSRRSLSLGGGVSLELVRVPAGAFALGSGTGRGTHPDESPAAAVRIERPFWMGRCEVTNEEYSRFDPVHDSHVETMHGYQFGAHGYPVDGPRQPVVRVSWLEASAFCEWLSTRTGLEVRLPSEAEWEYAARAGSAADYSFGVLEADYSAHANLGDKRLSEFALDTYVHVRLVAEPGKYDDWIPRDDRFDDGGFVSVDVGSYRPNAWGLHDMHGNVWEWTRSAYRTYPYREDDGRNDPASLERRVVRGGSWYDRPKRATSSYRLAYAAYQGVFNVGFRVVVEEP